MPLYMYTAMNLSMGRVSGEQDAIDKKNLESILNQNDLLLVSCQKKFSIETMFKGKIKLRDIIIFSRQFSVMMSAGVGMQEAVRLIAEGSENPRMKSALLSVREDLRGGITMSDSMKRRDYAFDDFFIGMVRVGEYSGSFEEIMKRVADFYEDEGRLKRSIRGALMYPIILIILTISVVTYLMMGIIPTFQEMFVQVGVARLPGITRVVIAISNFLKSYAIFTAAGILAAGFLIGTYLNSESGKERFHALQLRIPGIGKLIAKINASRFARSMDILTKSGVTIIESFDLIDAMIGNREIRKRFKLCRENIMTGHSYASSLQKMEVFPVMLISMVSVGEATGALAEVFDKTSSFFDEEANEAIKTLIQLIEPILLIFIALSIGVIILSIFLPMFDIMDAM